MQKKQTKNCCENCKYFIRHYVKFGLDFMAIPWGHGTKNLKKCKYFALDEVCELWEKPTISRQKECKRDVKEAIINISYQLNKFSTIYNSNLNNKNGN